MNTLKNGFRPGSKTDWRKRLASVIRYIDDLEACIGQANGALAQTASAAPSGQRFTAMSLPDWSDRLASLAGSPRADSTFDREARMNLISAYISDLERCLDRANSTIALQETYIGDLRRLVDLQTPHYETEKTEARQ